jgi:hypothetical protein
MKFGLKLLSMKIGLWMMPIDIGLSVPMKNWVLDDANGILGFSGCANNNWALVNANKNWTFGANLNICFGWVPM